MMSLFVRHTTDGVSPPKHVRDSLKDLWSAGTQSTKLSKRQIDVNVAEQVALLVNFGQLAIGGSHNQLDSISGSITVYATVVRGVCIIYAKQVDILLRDCESALVRKPVASIPTASRASLSSTKRRLSCSSEGGNSALRSRRSSMVTMPPIDSAEIEDFDAIMDLDALCAELTRRNVITETVVPVTQIPTLAGKRSRSGSSVSEDHVSVEHAPAFEAVAPSVDDMEFLAECQPPPAFTPPPTPPPNCPPRSARARTLKGFDPKTSFTTIQWSRLLRGEDITQSSVPSPAELARLAKPSDMDRLYLFLVEPASRGPTRSSRPTSTDAVSVAEAVDLDMDELRGDEFVDHFDDPVIPARPTGRPSDASSFAPSSRRQSMLSDVFEIRRQKSVTGDDFRRAIENELDMRHAKKGTLIGFSDVAPVAVSTKAVAAAALVQLLVLASKNELRFKSGSKVVFGCGPAFTLTSGSSSSSSSSSSYESV